MSKGWASIHRKLTDSDFWFSEKFTKPQAWIDLIINANHKAGRFWKRGIEVKIKRGQIGWSEVTMADRWGWSRGKVRRFLKWLEKDGKIEQQKIHKITTIITLVNYNHYQPTKQQTEHQTVHKTDNKQYTNNNDNNDKNTLSIEKPTEKQFKKISDDYNVPMNFVISKWDDLVNYCRSKGKTYTNYYATLRNWVKADAIKLRKEQDEKSKITRVEL